MARDPVDLDRLAAFADGTPDGVRAVIRLFIADSSETIDELAVAIARVDRPAIRLLAHRAGGTCASCGAARLSDGLFQLETRAAEIAGPDAAALMDAIRREHAAVARFLAAHLDQEQEP